MTKTIITADELPRVMACVGSLAMDRPEGLPVAEQSDAAREGTACHWLLSNVLTGVFPTPFERVGKQSPGGIFITSDMAEWVDEVVSAANRTFATMPIAHVEYNTDFSVNPNVEIHGRADIIVWDEFTATLYIDDAKFGWRYVEPDENWTLIAHAIGYVSLHRIAPRRIVFTIHQPQPFHPLGMSRPWEISGDQLQEYLIDLQTKLAVPSNVLTTGPQCDTCPARFHCPAAREAGMNAIDMSYEGVIVDQLDNDALGHTLTAIDRAIDHLETMRDAYKEMATHRVKNGAIVGDGWVLENHYGKRKFPASLTPGALEMLTGVPADKLTEPAKLVSPARAEKAGASETTINLFAKAPYLGVKLVRRDIDKIAKKLLT